MDLADGHIILVAEACQALDMQLLVVSFPQVPPLKLHGHIKGNQVPSRETSHFS